VQFFEVEMDNQLRERRLLQEDLRLAIQRDELELHYQPQAHINGTINGHRVRGPLQSFDAVLGVGLGLTWCRDCGVSPGDEVDAVLAPEGPQPQDLPDDIAAALAANPEAGAFFHSLATFYRKGYLRWINATTRRPAVRAERIAEMISLLEAGVKQRPQPKKT